MNLMSCFFLLAFSFYVNLIYKHRVGWTPLEGREEHPFFQKELHMLKEIPSQALRDALIPL